MADEYDAVRRSWLDAGTRLFFDTLDAIPDADLAGPSLLPGWTRAHVVSHLARNADALGNLLTWAQTGVETPMYPSREARAADIEAGVHRPPAEIRADVSASAQRLADAMDALPAAAWDNEVRTAARRPVPAREVVWMRVREVWVHAVDLAAGTSFAAIPGDLAAALLTDALGSIGKRPESPALTVRCTSDERTWRLRDGSAREVSGPYPALVAWALGRGGSDVAGWPPLPAWL